MAHVFEGQPDGSPPTRRFVPALFLCLALVGCGASAAEYRSNEERDRAIKRADMDNFRTEERLQKQIDELRARIEKLEPRP